jgi:hypothetical protein
VRTYRYHPKEAPFGKIFDTTGETAPRPPEGQGWVHHLGDLPKMTADQLIDAAVRAELKDQGGDRYKLDFEHRKKFGEEPNPLATNKEVENVMGNKRADGDGKIVPPKRAEFKRHFKERI